MTLSARTRFEILKRDGFKCRYCGATAMQTILHVDHVVAESAGGTDDPSNLVAACSACNLGKSNKPLDALDPKRAGSDASTEAMLEHAEQVREYLAATIEVENARDETIAWLYDEWGRRIGYVPPRNFHQIMRAAVMAHPLARILRALDATGGAADQLPTNDRVIRYFRTCLKNMRDEDGQAGYAADPHDSARDAVALVASALTAHLRTSDEAVPVLDRMRDIVERTPMASEDARTGAVAGLSRARQYAEAKPRREAEA